MKQLHIETPYRLAIFDLDGTVFDTLADIHNSLVAVFEVNNIIAPSKEEAMSFIGDGLRAFLQKAANRYGAECTDKLLEDFIGHYSKYCSYKTDYYSGVKELLDTLRSNGIKIAILSNKSEMLVQKILEDFKIQDYFISIAGGDTFAEKKPSPFPILETLRVTGFQPSEALMIGDSENDIAAGYAAGVKTCLCKYGYGAELKTTPDYAVDEASELASIILEGKRKK